MKIAACIILYRPDQFVEQNIISYINNLEKVYLIDNTETQSYDLKIIKSCSNKVDFIHNRINEGIAKRLNQACHLAIKDGFEYLLSMDQDSSFKEPVLNTYLNCIEQYSEKQNIAMFGINYKNKLTNDDCVYNKTKFLITSGSVINLSAYKNIGSFDENLFIDFVDTEYCFRSILKGYDIIELPNIFMQHNLGEAQEKRSIKTLKKTSRSFHSSLRLYYMVRNFFYLNSKYKHSFKAELGVHKKDILIRVKNKILYNSNRLQTIKFLFKGWKDYKSGRMEKLSD